MIYKTTSVKRVIAKVFADLQLTEDTHRISDMIEWAGEAVEKIGAFPSFINKVAGKDDIPFLEISNYQAVLPFDFHKLIQVNYCSSQVGPFYPMGYATGSFDWGSTLTTTATSDIDVVQPESSIVTMAMSLYDLSYADALALINNEPATRALIEGMLNSMETTSGTRTDTDYIDSTFDYTYLITPDYIKTNVETGYLLLAYQAIATDAEGYPLIPDSQSYMEAIYWYINMKLLYPEWKMGRVRDAVYYDARRSWNYYCKQAYGDALMPNRDQMESIKNTWIRLIPEIHEHDTSYSTLGQRQILYNAN